MYNNKYNYTKTVQFEFPLLHLKHRCLNDTKHGAFLTVQEGCSIF